MTSRSVRPEVAEKQAASPQLGAALRDARVVWPPAEAEAHSQAAARTVVEALRQEEVVATRDVAPVPPQEEAVAAGDVAPVQPQEEAVAAAAVAPVQPREEAVAAGAVAAVRPQEEAVVAGAVAAALQQEAAAVPDAVGAPRREVPGGPVAAWAFRRGRLRLMALPAPQPAAHSGHALHRLRIALL